jgi:putative tricarboxylic transport membrane protein
MRAADLITASVLMLLGGAVVYDAVRLGIGWETDGPRSGFFPFWLGVLLMAMCLAVLVQTARQPTSRPFVRREQVGPVLKVLWPALAAVILMQWVGLYVAAAIYIAFYMRWIGRHSWVTVVALAVGVPLVTFFVFERWFLVPMPKGPLEAWLGY